jgi:N-hydroxyarylamine O-acetyltransferase
MLAPGDSAAYLSRLGLPRPAAPTPEALTALQLAHLRRIPFENLDIRLGRPIRLDHDSLVRKVVHGGRGGYCYELNGLFATLLTSLGYTASLVSARVTKEGGGLSEEFDHLALLVTSPLVPEPLLVDVGFGDAFLEPLPLAADTCRVEGAKSVGIGAGDSGEWAYVEDHGNGWEVQYVFTTTPRDLSEFEPRNEWQQTSPDSHFTRRGVASLVTEMGRVTLTLSGDGGRLITTKAGDPAERTERAVAAHEVDGLLSELFGIKLDEAPRPHDLDPDRQRPSGSQADRGR